MKRSNNKKVDAVAEIVDEPTTTKDSNAPYSYLKDWTPEYAASAEFELVIQKENLPVHKHVMSMSPVFQRELFKTESKKAMFSETLKKKGNAPVSSRLPLSSPLFMDVSVEDMCLLLSHVYATDAALSAEKMDETRKLFALTEEFGFPAITRRCVNFVRNAENLTTGLRADLDANDATAAAEWLELAVKWDFSVIKDIVCDYAGEHFFEIYGREKNQEPDLKWADFTMVLDSELELWKRVARAQAERVEAGPSLASLISDEPSTTFIYGVLVGIFAGCLLPSWMFFLILIGTVLYIINKMPSTLLAVIRKTVEGAIQGIMHGDKTETNDAIEEATRTYGKQFSKSKGKPPALRRASHITA